MPRLLLLLILIWQSGGLLEKSHINRLICAATQAPSALCYPRRWYKNSRVDQVTGYMISVLQMLDQFSKPTKLSIHINIINHIVTNKSVLSTSNSRLLSVTCLSQTVDCCSLSNTVKTITADPVYIGSHQIDIASQPVPVLLVCSTC